MAHIKLSDLRARVSAELAAWRGALAWVRFYSAVAVRAS